MEKYLVVTFTTATTNFGISYRWGVKNSGGLELFLKVFSNQKIKLIY
jgi:hypothetical protein